MIKNKIIIASLLVLFTSGNLFSQIKSYQIEKLTKAMNNISSFYTDSVDNNDLVEKAIISVLKELDPHSRYYDSERVAEINRGLEGSFDGIGITYNMLQDTILILSTMQGGPSEQAGLKAGDRIIAVEKKNMAGVKVTSDDIREALLGEKGSDVNVSVVRRGEENPLQFTITRDKIPVFSIESAYMARPKTGYIRLNRFSGTSSKEFDEAAEVLAESGAENLILDLRDNGGGYLRTAVSLTDNFLSRKKMIVYTEGLNNPKKEYKSTSSQKFRGGRVVVLIDEGSASASEILSGALQDWDRAVIVGRRSFGKGLVQRPFYLNDGSMMRLTIARYYTPNGRSIQKPYTNADDYKNDISNRLAQGELTNKDSIQFSDSLKFKTLNNERVVYGGGGIMPDVFVALDTLRLPEIYRKLIRKGLVHTFVHQYVDDNRIFLNTLYSDFSLFEKNFFADEKLFRSFLDFLKKEAEKEDIDEVRKSLNMHHLRSNKYIKNHIKSLVASDLWDMNEYFQISNTESDIYLKGLEIIEDKKLYNSYLSATK